MDFAGNERAEPEPPPPPSSVPRDVIGSVDKKINTPPPSINIYIYI